ncbi:MAG: hypothetical protein JO263_01160 [Candidatus Eremiobacteraeota bacterium]|nr:hypothetical protein [Candidatus Eremiobacteraeota bacterium]
MKVGLLWIAPLAALVGGCGWSAGGLGVPFAQRSTTGEHFGAQPNVLSQYVYWTLKANATLPQVEVARTPLKNKSKVGNVKSTSKDDLLNTSGMAVDSAGRLWILSFGTTSGSPSAALVFKLPLTAKSLPLYSFVLSHTMQSTALAFDPSGNLWVNSPGNGGVLEYAAPFKKSGTLKPKRGIVVAYGNGIAVDKSARVYLSIQSSVGTKSIAVIKPPYQNHDIYYLNGLKSPGGLIFDRKGNLYASTQDSAALVRYNSNDLNKSDSPSIVDYQAPYANTYFAGFAFSANGDLYGADCSGVVGRIFVYPTGTKKFSNTMRPSLVYANTETSQARCVWGIAIK